MATGQIKAKDRQKEERKANGRSYSPKGEEKKVFEEYKRRKVELQQSRKDVNGVDIDAKMRDWDRKYFADVADIPASELDPNQKPVAMNNAFGKVTTALSILIDRNPDFTLEEDSPKYSANRELLKQLAKKSFRNTNSLGQFKLSVFNMARHGWFIGRTYNRRLIHEAKYLVGVDSSGRRKYEKSMVTKMDDIAYMNLSNYNAWIDEETRPEDFFSTRDWMWREVWHIDKLRNIFPEDEFPNMKFVRPGGDTSEIPDNMQVDTSDAPSDGGGKDHKKNLVEVYFYENQYDDWFIVEANGVMIVWEPLPQDHKRLSCVYGTWHLRSDDNIYGIGIIEEMEGDEEMANRINNMGLRQLLISIAPPGFYTGSEDPEDENLKITPGILRRTLDPKNITFLQIPEGNQKWVEINQWLENKQADKTGINETLEGQPSNGSTDTAFELGINREASLKRLRVPLRSLQYALDWEFQNRIALIQQVYSDYDVEHLASEDQIMAYLDEIGADPQFFYIENEGIPGEERFFVRRFRETKLGLDQDDNGNYIEADSERFFKITPQMLAFSGTVRTDIDSLLVNSEELEKADTLRMSNIILPIIAEGDPTVQGPAVKQILQAFNKDPKKWLPKDWLVALGFVEEQKAEQAPGMQVPENVQTLLNNQRGAPSPLERPETAETIVPAADVQSEPSLSGRFGAAFRAFQNPDSMAQ